MGLDLRLQHKMSQQLVMTPQLQQAIKLLALSHVEMAQALRDELAQNPLLEERDLAASGPQGEIGREAQPPVSGPGESVQAAEAGESMDEPVATPELVRAAEPLASLNGQRLGSAGGYGDGDAGERLVAHAVSLPEYLCQQLQLVTLSPTQRRVAEILVEALDADGYLPATIVEDTALRLSLAPGAVAYVLARLQECDPTGVGARSLSECLTLQAQQLSPCPPLLLQIIAHHLPQVAARKYGAIARSLRCSADEVATQARRLAGLQPRPGRAFDQDTPSYVVPDLFVEATGHDDPAYVVWPNTDGLPRVAISRAYDAAHTANWPAPARAYVQDKLRSAQWLLRSVHMRQRTMLRVMRSIVAFQRAFFEQGVTHLRPMVLRDVAAQLGMHESTISRVTTNKYVYTPHGTFELKFFFSSSVRSASDAGAHRASQSVRQSIQRLIDREDKAEPLSDQKIVELLLRQDIRIARRTVAKYRKMLNRQPSSSRRREL